MSAHQHRNVCIWQGQARQHRTRQDQASPARQHQTRRDQTRPSNARETRNKAFRVGTKDPGRPESRPFWHRLLTAAWMCALRACHPRRGSSPSILAVLCPRSVATATLIAAQVSSGRNGTITAECSAATRNEGRHCRYIVFSVFCFPFPVA